MKLVCVSLSLTRPEARVIVLDRNGRRRLVGLRWERKTEDGGLPPEWWSTVCGEIEFQDAEALAKARGGWIPR